MWMMRNKVRDLNGDNGSHSKPSSRALLKWDNGVAPARVAPNARSARIANGALLNGTAVTAVVPQQR